MASLYVKYTQRLLSMTTRDVSIHTVIIMLNITIEIFIFQSIFNYANLMYSLGFMR